MMNKFKNQKGFTLVELMVSLGLLVIVMGAIYAFLNTSTVVSASINRDAKRQSTCLTTMQQVRAVLANAADVSIVNAEEAINTPVSGYNYIYCGPDGGISLYNGTSRTSINTTGALKTEKVFVTFQGQDIDTGSLPVAYHALKVNVSLYPCTLSDSNLVTNTALTYDTARSAYLGGLHTPYSVTSAITLHNSLKIKTADDYDSTNYVMARAIRFKYPDPSEAVTFGGGETESSTESTTADPTATTVSQESTETTTNNTNITETETTPEETTLEGYFEVRHDIINLGTDYYEYRIVVDNQTYDDVADWGYDIDGLPSDPLSVDKFGKPINATIVTGAKKVHFSAGETSLSGDVSEYTVRVYFGNVPTKPEFTATYVVDSVSGTTVSGHIDVTNVSAYDANGNTKWTVNHTFDADILSFTGWGWGSINKSSSGASLTASLYETSLPAGQTKTYSGCDIKLKDADSVEVKIHFDNSNIYKNGEWGEVFDKYFYNDGSGEKSSAGTSTVYISPAGNLTVGLLGGWSTHKNGTSYTYFQLKNTPITDIWVQGQSVSTSKPSNWGVAPEVTLTTTTTESTSTTTTEETTTETTTIGSDTPTEATTEATTETTTEAAAGGDEITFGKNSINIPASYAGQNISVKVNVTGDLIYYFQVGNWFSGYTFTGTPDISFANGGTSATIKTNGGTGNLIFNCSDKITIVGVEY